VIELYAPAANEIESASRLISFPVIQIGSLRTGKKGVRALSEVGAHAFARTYFNLSNPEHFMDRGDER
jgi:hypothetical protein